jgi:hypothetical protein
MEALMNRIPEQIDRESAVAGQGTLTNGSGSEAYEGPRPLPSDENERLIALCEAPALLWKYEPVTARTPEPFGMIA